MTLTTAEQAFDLEKAFDKAFGPLVELDPNNKEPEPKLEPKESAPPATEEPPVKEEPVTEPELTPEPETKVTEPLAHPDDEPDEELDKIRIHPDSRPDTIDAFRNVRGMLKGEKKISKELRERLENQEKELGTLRGAPRPVTDPDVQKELEDLRTFRTRHQVFDDTGYQVQFENPVRDIFDDIVKDVKGLSVDPAAGEDWEKQVRSAGPDRLNRDYWTEGVIDQCKDPLHKERLVRKINALLEAQGKRDEFRNKMSSEPDAYEKFRAQQAADYWQLFSVEAEDEAKKIIPSLGDWASPRDLAMAKTTQERTAAEAHNKVYKEYENIFQQAITDAATQGPRGMTRVAVKAVLAEKYKRDLDTANTRIAKLQADLKSAQDELTKISSARSRVANSSGSAGVKTETTRSRIGKSVDDAIREHFGT